MATRAATWERACSRRAWADWADGADGPTCVPSSQAVESVNTTLNSALKGFDVSKQKDTRAVSDVALEDLVTGEAVECISCRRVTRGLPYKG